MLVVNDVRKEISQMIAFKNDKLIQTKTDKMYVVVCADSEVFVTALLRFDEKTNTTTTDYTQGGVYTNNRSINTLDSLGFNLV